jgi:cell wall-associated NlpC family hydrolase
MAIASDLPKLTPMSNYQSLANINIYDSPNFTALATQMAKGRYLRILQPEILQVQLLEDGYVGFIRNLFDLEQIEYSYQPQNLSDLAEIRTRISGAIAYAQSAMNTKNEYLWGGTLPPNFDCSGLVQAAYCSVGIWLPRDAYQQQAFTTHILREELEAGDLIFFGLGTKANHVGIYLGGDRYIHSSGQEKGRNGIAIDSLIENGDRVSQHYASELRGFGKVTKMVSMIS